MFPNGMMQWTSRHAGTLKPGFGKSLPRQGRPVRPYSATTSSMSRCHPVRNGKLGNGRPVRCSVITISCSTSLWIRLGGSERILLRRGSGGFLPAFESMISKHSSRLGFCRGQSSGNICQGSCRKQWLLSWTSSACISIQTTRSQEKKSSASENSPWVNHS
ncbi:hypothetical protein SDC9_202922 [bioreactor metagenome]|uniref:Uncharacterized protein n=1 Tax=bioreactor metagenome TaxID=1076179 RepID=A0A645IWI7_9ZZZZ